MRIVECICDPIIGLYYTSIYCLLWILYVAVWGIRALVWRSINSVIFMIVGAELLNHYSPIEIIKPFVDLSIAERVIRWYIKYGTIILVVDIVALKQLAYILEYWKSVVSQRVSIKGCVIGLFVLSATCVAIGIERMKN